MNAILPLNTDMATANLFSSIAAKPAISPSVMANINAAAEDFEAMFATQMLKPMFDTVRINDSFGGGHGEEVMRTFMLVEYGKMIAKTGILGVGEKVKAEMIRIQESVEKTKNRGKAPTQDATEATPYANANLKEKGSLYHATA